MGFVGVRIRLESDVLGEGVEVRAFEGSEVLNRIFEFDFEVVASEGYALDVEEVVSQPVSVIFEVDDSLVDGHRSGTMVWREVRRVHGVICECEDLLFAEDLGTYHLRVVPRFWLTSLVETLDIFMDLTVPEIIGAKLRGLGLLHGKDFELRLTANYPTREFVVQYQETDLAFISRLCEHSGIGFFFEHTETRDVVVFSDDNGAFQEIVDGGAARFSRQGQRVGVFELSTRTRLVPKRFIQREYNYRTPQTDLVASVEMSDGAAGGIVEYGGHFKDETEGQHLAEVRKQERRAQRYVFRGAGTDPRLGAGARFVLEEHPRGEVDLALTEVHHRATQSTLHGGEGQAAGYENTFSALSINTVYRPPRMTPKPRVHGFLTGIIDGPAGDIYAPVDEHGRYLVRFMFDTNEPGERKASRPVRMMQPHSGPGYGMHFPLRVGTEVLIFFLGGDPDRPVIAGTVPNPQTESPVKAENYTKNVIRTGGGNEFDIDDTEDEQRIKISTPRAGACLQLGSPNAPEDGAFLGTANNITTTAGGVNSGLSSFTNAWSVFHDAWSNHVTDFAGAMTPLLTLQWFDSWVQNTAGIVSTVLGATLSVRDALITQKQISLEEKKKTKDAAADQLAEATAARTAALEALQQCQTCTTRPRDDNGGDPLAALYTAMEDYDQAQRKLEDDQAALTALQDSLSAAVEAGSALTAIELEDELIPAMEATIEQDQADVVAKKAALDEQLALVQANPDLLDCSCDDVSLAERLAQYQTTNDTMAAARSAYDSASQDVASLESDLEDDGEKLKGVQQAQQGIDEVTAMESTATGVLFSLITTLCGDGVQLYARDTADFMLEEAIRQYEGNMFQVDLPETKWTIVPPFMKMVPPTYVGTTPHTNQEHTVISRAGDWAAGIKDTTRMVPTSGAGILKAMKHPAAAFLALTPILGPWLTKRFCSDAFNEARNIQGSEAHLVLFGKKSAFLTGEEHTTVSSRHKVVVTADELVEVHSRGQAELAGNEVLVSAADLADIYSRGKVSITATGPKDTTSANTDIVRWNDFEADKVRALLEMERGAVTLTSKKKDGSADVATLTLTADDANDVGTAELKAGDTHYIKLEQKSSATDSMLTLETPGSFKINAGKNGEIIAAEKLTLKIGTDGPSIELTKDSIVLKAGDKSALELKKDLAVLKFGTATVVKCNSDGVSIINGTSNKIVVSNSGVDIKGGAIKEG